MVEKLKEGDSSYDPKSSAEEFAQAVMVTTPYHANLQNAVDALDHFLNFNQTQEQSEYQDKLRERINTILQKSKVTPQFATYITVNLLVMNQMGIWRSPADSMKDLAGVDLEHREYGIFDPKKAQKIEGAMLKKVNKRGLEGVTAISVAKIDLSEWREAFKKLHK